MTSGYPTLSTEYYVVLVLVVSNARMVAWVDSSHSSSIAPSLQQGCSTLCLGIQQPDVPHVESYEPP